jgi:hypothetical protein
MGYLNIDAKPWANVTINGRRAGETPLDSLPHEVGTLRLVLSCPDTGRSVERTVHLSAEQAVDVKVDLQ